MRAVFWKYTNLLIITTLLTLLTILLCKFIYLRELQTFTVSTYPVLPTKESVKRVSKSTNKSLVDVPLVTKRHGESPNVRDEIIHSMLWYKKQSWISASFLNSSLQICVYRNCQVPTMRYIFWRNIKLLIITSLLTPVLCTFIYLIKLQYFTCPVLPSKESVKRVSKSTKHSLVDFPIVTKRHGESHNVSDDVIHSMVWYNKPYWINASFLNESLQKCVYRNCRLSFDNDKLNLKKQSAIVFTFASRRAGRRPPLQPHERPRDQVWVFFYMESPIHLWKSHAGILLDAWQSTFNWSWNYRSDSDIVNPYGMLATKQQTPDRNYLKVYKQKTKFAAWFVSNCHTVSGREKFVQHLRTYGIPVDIYGKCGEMGPTNRTYLNKVLNNDYKFYFAFENSFCPDYITEKFFANFDLDVVLVVRGGANYRELLPRDTFIDASYKSPQDLAYYLIKVSLNETLYTQYLREKDKYTVTHHPIGNNLCKLCEMLNHKEENANVYENVNDHLYKREYSCQECLQSTSWTSYQMAIVIVYLLVYITCIMFELRAYLRIYLINMCRKCW